MFSYMKQAERLRIPSLVRQENAFFNIKHLIKLQNNRTQLGQSNVWVSISEQTAPVAPITSKYWL